MEKFLAGLNNFTFNGLSIYTPTKLPSQSLTPKRYFIYICKRELGRDLFSNINKVIDVNTSAIYACKIFFEF